MKLGKRNMKSNTLNRGWLEPVDAAKWPMYLDCGSLISVMCYSTTVRLCILLLISF